ncbi:hypothetical protein [Planctomyces sp. SH-PL62]|uniref:hypothetical protein n=1 Tax=Planctomyces sp. SH-PL62 TaxID=1636152 RepID=UPI00078ED961|nr:hypothetical protein [Planctomyces sp. SH-PL62]AMV40495.1 hypothetical protein VT85_23900 [Planctomyces sp. SH-PL62]
MTEQAARSLAVTVGGEAVFPMPGNRFWGVKIERFDGQLAAIEDNAGWAYRDWVGELRLRHGIDLALEDRLLPCRSQMR